MISGCARAEDAQRVSQWLCQTGMEPGLSAQLGQMDPHSFTTVNAACFMPPAVLISCTLFNSSPYNIHFSKPVVTVKNCPWNKHCAVVLWRVEISGTCGVVIYVFFFTSLRRSKTDDKSLNHQAKFIFRAVGNRSCSLKKAYNFLFTMWPRSIRI